VADRRVVDLADVAEVDLGDFARVGLDRDRHVGGGDAALAAQPSDESLHRRLAAREVRMLQPQAVADRARPGAALDHRHDVRAPRLDRRDLLLRHGVGHGLGHRRLDHLQRRQVIGVPNQQPGVPQPPPVVPFRRAPHAEQAAHLAGAGVEAV